MVYPSSFYFGKTKFALAITLVQVIMWRKELTMDVLLMTSRQNLSTAAKSVPLHEY